MFNHIYVDANFPSNAGERWAKRNNISASWFSLTQHTSQLSEFIQNLKTRALIAGEKSEIDFMRKKEKKR